MAVNKDSNVYTIIFAIILVVIVGGLLAFISISLKPMQDENLKNEKKQSILNCLPGLKDIAREDAGGVFSKYVKERVILNFNSSILENSSKTGEINSKDLSDAFNIDLLKESKTITDISKRNYPLFVCEVDGKRYYVAPVMGKGLWAAVWGYIALNSEGKMIEGAVFDHKSETPGLGAEITEDFFENQFIGKSIDEDGRYSKIEVNKPGNELNSHQVDGISGGTFTSVGVEKMMTSALEVYYNYIRNKK
jgi:Na+-transporting NADH:ubiquinone oxidoreductase subunit C